MELVGQNNLSKFVPVGKPVQYDALTQETSFNSEHQVTVVKNKSTGKIAKHANFKPVELVDCLPMED